MNMKKLMAVVLAVAIAISAMAVNVFAAETYRIDLKKTETERPSHGLAISTFTTSSVMLIRIATSSWYSLTH